jgi:tubulin-like protein
MFIKLKRILAAKTYVMVAGVGTIPKQIANGISTLLTACTGSFDPSQFLAYDTDNTNLDQKTKNPIAGHLPQDCMIETSLVDSISYAKLANTGKLYFLRNDKSIAATLSGHGAGGNPQASRAVFTGARKKIKRKITKGMRAFRDSDRRRVSITKNEADKEQGTVLPVVLCFNTAGGTGTGSLLEMVYLFHEVAKELGIEIRLTLIGLCLGTIDPIDQRQAYENQYHLLHELQVLNSGKWVDPRHDLNGRPPFDDLILISNRNNHGELRTLQQLMQIQTLFIYHQIATELGAYYRQRSIDMTNNPAGEFGESRCVSTFGMSFITINRDQVAETGATSISLAMINGMMMPVKNNATVEEAHNIAGESEIINLPHNKQAVTSLMRIKQNGGTIATNLVTGFFTGQVKGTRSLKKAQSMYRVYGYALEQLVQGTYNKSITFNAHDKLSVLKQNISNFMSLCMQGYHGVSRAKAVLNALRTMLKHSAESNRKQQAEKQKRLQVSRKKIDAAGKILSRIGVRGWFAKLFLPFTILKLNRVLSKECPKALALEMELKSREILNDFLYPVIKRELQSAMESVLKIEEKLTIMKTSLERKQNELYNQDQTFWNPCGIEIVNKEYLENTIEEFVQKHDGWDTVVQKHFNKFIAIGSGPDWLPTPPTPPDMRFSASGG